jgi:hypothetical protein
VIFALAGLILFGWVSVGSQPDGPSVASGGVVPDEVGVAGNGLTHARHQIGVLAPVTDSFLIPDNHIGRATVSSIAVAHDVQAMGGQSIACVNSRDRNLLGFAA